MFPLTLIKVLFRFGQTESVCCSFTRWLAGQALCKRRFGSIKTELLQNFLQHKFQTCFKWRQGKHGTLLNDYLQLWSAVISCQCGWHGSLVCILLCSVCSFWGSFVGGLSVIQLLRSPSTIFSPAFVQQVIQSLKGLVINGERTPCCEKVRHTTCLRRSSQICRWNERTIMHCCSIVSYVKDVKFMK